MVTFETALKAKIPFIGVQTDDPVNFRAVLQTLAGKAPEVMPSTHNAPLYDTRIYYTDDIKNVTVEKYRKLVECGGSCIVWNLEEDEKSPLILDVGVLPTPVVFYEEFLTKMTTGEMIPLVVDVLKGLSAKTAREICLLTMARTGSLLPTEIRKTRQLLEGDHPGLYRLDTDYDFYEWPKELKEWVDLNDSFFLNPNTPEKLVPRGLLLAGKAGVGKSMSALVLAKHWDVSLFRLDIATSLNRWLGESESRIARNLSLIEQSAPCVWLLDEAEKLFGHQDEGVSGRILSQILWWLQYHRAKVLTIMTTNNLDALPKELYRAERIDRVIQIEELSLSGAKLFAPKVYESVLGKKITPIRRKALFDLIDKENQPKLSHARVRVIVYDAIKTRDWMNGGVE